MSEIKVRCARAEIVHHLAKAAIDNRFAMLTPCTQWTTLNSAMSITSYILLDFLSIQVKVS